MKPISFNFLYSFLGLALLASCDSGGSSATTSDQLSSAQVQEAGNVTSALSSSALNSSNFSLKGSSGNAQAMAALNRSDIMAAARELKFYSRPDSEIRWSLVTNESYWERPTMNMDSDTDPREFSALTDCSQTETDSSFTLTCNSDETVTSTCDSITYTFTDLALTLGITLTENVFGIAFDMSTTVSGGEFDEDVVACDFNIQVDLSEDQTDFEDAVSMESCNCSINSESVGCTDLESSWEESSCNSFESQ